MIPPKPDRTFVLTLLGTLIFTLLLAAPPWVAAEEAAGGEVSVPIDAWLLLGPAPVPRPAFQETSDGDGETLGVSELLETTRLAPSSPWPAEGDEVAWPGAPPLAWRTAEAPAVLTPRGSEPQMAYLAAYLEADRFLEARLEVVTPHLARIFLDGEQVAEKTAADPVPAAEPKRSRGARKAAKAPKEAGTATAELALTTGKHLLVVQALREPSGPEAWMVTAKLALPRAMAAALGTGTSPRRGVRMADLLEVDTVSGLSVSAGGEWVALEMTHPAIPADDGASWVEIRRTDDGSLVRSFRGAASVSELTWGPGTLYSYVSRDGETATLWVGDLASGEVRALLEKMERLGPHRWSPDGRSLVYSVSSEAKEDERGARRLRDLRDRWSGWRNRDSLYQVMVSDGTRRRLTAGDLSSRLEDISPDGSRLLVTRERPSDVRPFSVGELWELPLGTGTSLAPNRLAEVPWLVAARYAPDGETVLVTAGPSGFGEIGVNVSEGRVPNEYDRQLYLLRRSGEVEPITRTFDPAVQDAAWSRRDGDIYLVAEDGSWVRLYRYRFADERFETLETGVEVVDSMDLSADGSMLVFTGSSVTTPHRVLALGTAAGSQPRLVLDPGRERFAQVDFGAVEPWSFEVGGHRITGRIHYPPDFDPTGTYPLLVYYYGGTVPIERAFGGRYPKSFWTANGYVVLILQPSGATGFGQEFSSRHVNDWGKTVADEILQGVERFVESHPFADRERIGCLGGSYGGFMTMLLLTRSDLFRAAVSHAGISSIASYWGQGWWGFLYNAVAGADSYPWNRRDLYVDQSPLFQADRIRTPLLLLHGTADPNVPPGESEQMYTALKLLGREVELIEIEGEQHWIQTYGKRQLWWQTLIAWFDKHLKGQPELWDHLWKDKG